jgi:non-specific serine/threonine protein kinase
MAPELIAGGAATIRSDIYALGVIVYQLAVGDIRRPLASDWSEDIQDPLLREDIRSCVAGDPAKRFAGAAQLAANLRQLPARKAALKE